MTRILCLDDQPEVLNLLGMILKRNGYEVLGSTNGHESHQPA